MHGTSQKTPLAISEVHRKRANWREATRCLNLTTQGPSALRSYGPWATIAGVQHLDRWLSAWP